MRTIFLIAAAALGSASAANAVSVGGGGGGTIIGIFSNPITAGNIIHYPALNSPPAFFNNAGTAVYSIQNSTDPTLSGGFQATGSALSWGTNSPASYATYSQLTFFGGQVPADPSQPFTAGTLNFLNGTSTLQSLIFGANLSFYNNSVSPSNFLGTDQIIITTTSNLNVSIPQDADYINICGNGSQICNMSIEAYESAQVGNGLNGYTVLLTGMFVADPHLGLTGVQSGPNQSGNGGIGNQQPLGATPLPASWTMMLAGLAVVGFAAHRRNRKACGLPVV